MQQVYCNQACNEKDNWLEQNPEASTCEYITMKCQLDDTLAPIWMKLNEARKYNIEVGIQSLKFVSGNEYFFSA